ncbi:MAG: DUF932 domain-containing protein [Planctomycetales bacterium]|nr:DUF932 domain-containing protein [Planctomycetales bacterium]
MLPKQLAEARETRLSDATSLQKLLESDEYRTSYVRTALDQIEFYDNGTMTVEGRNMPYLQGVHEDLAKCAGIPLSFGYGIPFELFKTNFEGLKKLRSRGITLCVVRDSVVGIAPAGYHPVKTREVLNRLDLNEDVWRCNKATVSDFGVELDLAVPTATIEPEQGDIINVGIRITNSETGGDALCASLSTLRLVCTNGSVFRSTENVVYFKKYQKRTADAALRAFISHALKLKDRAQSLAQNIYQDVLDRPLRDDQMVSLFRGLQRRVGSSEEAESILDIESEERRDIQRRERLRGSDDEPALTRFMVFDVHNQITAAARRRRLLLRQSLEQLGGSLLFSAS